MNLEPARRRSTARRRRASCRADARAEHAGSRRRAARLERHRDRAVEHGDAPRAAADQSAHVVLLPLRAADGERRGAERLRRVDVGTVLHLPGLQRHAGWMHTSSGVDDIDEYLETVDEEGRQATSTSTATRSARSIATKITVPYKTASGHGEEGVHRLPHAPRADRPREPTASGSAFALMQEPVKALTQSYSRTKAKDYKSFRRRWSCTPTRRTTRSSPTPTATSRTSTRNFIPKRDPKFDWTQAGGRQQSGDGVERRCSSVDETPESAESGERLALQLQQLAVVGGGPEQPEAGGLSRRTSRRGSESRRAACTRSACSRTRRTSRSTRCSPRRTTATCRRSTSRFPRCSRRTTRSPATDPLKAKLAEQIALLRDVGLPLGRRLGADVARRVLGRGAAAPVGGERGGRRVADEYVATNATPSSCCRRSPRRRDKLAADFGNWKTPWGDINRFQRLTDDIVPAVQRRGAEHSGRLHLGDAGARSRRSARARTRTRRSGTARAATASSRSSSSATACAPGRSPPAARAAIRRRRTSTIRRSATHRRSARRLLLPDAAQGAHRADVPPGGVNHV